MARYNGSLAKVPVIEKIIKDVLGVDAEYEPQFDRLKFRTDDRVQSRIDKNSAPKHMVDRYAHQMAEYEFPPIVITADNPAIKVDGNTRDAAHGKRGDRYVPVLIIPVKWDGADEATRRKLLYISEAINNMNGLPLDEGERRKMAETMIEEGSADEDIAGKVGISLSIVRTLRDKYKAKARLRQVGIPVENVKEVLRAFGKPNAQALDDASFRGVAELAVDAGLSSSEINALAASVNAQGSEEMKRDRLARERQARDTQITAQRAGQDHPQLAKKLSDKLAILFEHPMSVFVEHDPEKVREYLETLEKAGDVLAQIRALHANLAATAQAEAQAQAESRPLQ